MAIEFLGNGDGATNDSSQSKGVYHLDGVISDFTFCGITLDGDLLTAGSYRNINKTINCPECVSLILHCRGVRVIKPN